MQRVVQELVDVIGLAGAIEIVRRWGGRDFYVPVAVGHGHPLALVLGLELARKLVEVHGGGRLQLPREQAALLGLRDELIVRRVTVDRISHEAAGLEFGLTRQAIGHVLKRHAERNPGGQTLAASDAAT